MVFRKGLSCETQKCATLNDILGVTDRESSVHATVLDLSKAFDRVPHPLAVNAEIFRLSWYENLSAKLDT